VYGDYKPTGRWWHGDFYPEVHFVATKLVPVVSIDHLVIQQLIGITCQVHMLGTARTYPQVMVAQWHAQLELLFAALTGQAQYPSQSLLWNTAQSSLCASMETTTKPSRRWQPQRVTSTTGLQLDHLVPLDAISQCNALESLTCNGSALLASTSELEASQTKHTQGQHIPKVFNLSQARAPPLFIAPKPNRVVGALEHISARSPDSNVRAPDKGW
jgi:hypothetical protein